MARTADPEVSHAQPLLSLSTSFLLCSLLTEVRGWAWTREGMVVGGLGIHEELGF